jgi:hypothetical protein
LLDLDQNKRCEQHTRENEKDDGPRIGPTIRIAAPLQGQQKADNCWKKGDHSKWVHMPDPSLDRCFRPYLESGRQLKENGEDYNHHAPDGQIDVEAVRDKIY